MDRQGFSSSLNLEVDGFRPKKHNTITSTLEIGQITADRIVGGGVSGLKVGSGTLSHPTKDSIDVFFFNKTNPKSASFNPNVWVGRDIVTIESLYRRQWFLPSDAYVFWVQREGKWLNTTKLNSDERFIRYGDSFKFAPRYRPKKKKDTRFTY